MMFWVGVVVTLFGAFLILPRVRNRIRGWRRGKNPKIEPSVVDERTNGAIDTIRFIAIVSGLVLSGVGHVRGNNEKTQQTEDAKKETEELRKRVSGVADDTQPRRLDLSTKQAIHRAIEKLGCPGELVIGYDSANFEARRYADDFRDVFRTANCVANLYMMQGNLKPDTTGLWVLAARDRKLASPNAATMIRTLQAADLSVGTGTHPEMEGERFLFVVGAKP